MLCFSQAPGQVAADTKHDLAANPLGFLSQAMHAYSQVFPMGQMQNQAYGYLFPQGAFFVATDALPDWIAQRLWWTLVLGLGYSGMLILLRRWFSAEEIARQPRVSTNSTQSKHTRATLREALRAQPWGLMLPSALYALSPRALTTLTAISSETWPVMLAPWVLLPLVARKPWVGGSVIAVALMGAVNAAATLAALLPAAIWLLLNRRRFGTRPLIWWCVGVVCVSLWWVIPLLVFARYATPFTDYIESAWVTTRWLNLGEVLRGTTSWAPYVDTERQAGHALVAEPVLVVATLAVAAFGFIGLASARIPHRKYLLTLLGLGLCIFISAHWLSLNESTSIYDGPLAAFRNLHKFDPLVRMPLVIGMAALPARHRQALALAGVAAVAPIFGRLLPLGTYQQVPAYWQQTAAYLNANAADTRTLVLPASSFVRQTWGWTRDEPLQPLLDVPWVVRDAVPLIPPETIRNLDATVGTLAPASLERLGVGALVVRHDLQSGELSDEAREALRALGSPTRTFGEVDVYLLDPPPQQVHATPVRVAGGGEALAWLPKGTYELVDGPAEIVTDTPLEVERNYGTLYNATSAPLAPGDTRKVHNRVKDYASVGKAVEVVERGGHVSDASLRGDLNAPFDDNTSTAWEGEWLQLNVDRPSNAVRVLVTQPTQLTVEAGDFHATVQVERERTLDLPTTSSVRLSVAAGGIAEAQMVGSPIERVVTVPANDAVQQFVFHRQGSPIDRAFSVPRTMDFTLSAPAWIDGQRVSGRITLEPGWHRLRTVASTLSLTNREPEALGTPVVATPLAYNAGLRANGVPPVSINADQLAFPADQLGDANEPLQLSFVGETPYRLGLFSGAGLALCTVGVCCWRRRPKPNPLPSPHTTQGASEVRRWAGLAGLGIVGIVGLGPGVVMALPTWAVLRWTRFTRGWWIAACLGVAAVWLAREPWPSPGYPDHLMWICAGAVCAVYLPRWTTRTETSGQPNAG